MSKMTHFKAVLKDEFFARLGGLSPYLRPEDILAVASQHYHWRERLWTPLQTVWTFLIQNSGDAILISLANRAP